MTRVPTESAAPPVVRPLTAYTLGETVSDEGAPPVVLDPATTGDTVGADPGGRVAIRIWRELGEVRAEARSAARVAVAALAAWCLVLCGGTVAAAIVFGRWLAGP